jgi:hypothetical protein
MDDSGIMNILDGLENSANEGGGVAVQNSESIRMEEWDGVRLVIIAFGADAVKQLASCAEIKAQIEIVGSLSLK